MRLAQTYRLLNTTGDTSYHVSGLDAHYDHCFVVGMRLSTGYYGHNTTAETLPAWSLGAYPVQDLSKENYFFSQS